MVNGRLRNAAPVMLSANALTVRAGVCTENSNPDVVMVKPAEDGL